MILQITYRIPTQQYRYLSEQERFDYFKKSEEAALLRNAGAKINEHIKFKEVPQDEFISHELDGEKRYRMEFIAIDIDEWLQFRNKLKELLKLTGSSIYKDVGILIKNIEQYEPADNADHNGV